MKHLLESKAEREERLEALDPPNRLLALWSELRELMFDVDDDVIRNAKNSLAAGVRMRKKLRKMCTLAHELVMLSMTTDRQTQKERQELFSFVNSGPDGKLKFPFTNVKKNGLLTKRFKHVPHKSNNNDT